MEPIEPIKGAPISGIPLTEEMAAQQKKMLKSAKMETPTAAEEAREAEDVSAFSQQAAAELSRTRYDHFLEAVKDDILKLDPRSESYLPEATLKMVGAALRQEYGEGLTGNPGFSQMESVLTRKILNNPQHTAIIQDFLEMLNYVEGEPPPEKEA